MDYNKKRISINKAYEKAKQEKDYDKQAELFEKKEEITKEQVSEKNREFVEKLGDDYSLLKELNKRDKRLKKRLK